MGIVLPLLGLVTPVSVPLTTQSGEWLEQHVDRNGLVRRHAELADGLLPWAGGMFILAVVVWWAVRRTAAPGTAPSTHRFAGPLRIATVVLSLMVSVGAVMDVYRISDSGAKADWDDGFSR
jgi:hypothetical protein